MSYGLAVVGKSKRKVKVGGAQRGHYGLQFIFACARHAYGVTLDLRLGFRVLLF